MEKKKHYIKPVSKVIHMDNLALLAGSLDCDERHYDGKFEPIESESVTNIWNKGDIIEGNPDDIDAKKNKWNKGLWDD